MGTVRPGIVCKLLYLLVCAGVDVWLNRSTRRVRYSGLI